MTRAEFIIGLVQRKRNVIQKEQRVASIGEELNDMAEVLSPGLRAQLQDELEAVLAEEADFVADYIEQLSSHPSSAVGGRFQAGTMVAGGREPHTINSESKL